MKRSKELMKQCFEEKLRITSASIVEARQKLLALKEEGAFIIRRSAKKGFYSLEYYSSSRLTIIEFRLTSRGTISSFNPQLHPTIEIEYQNFEAIKKALHLGRQFG